MSNVFGTLLGRVLRSDTVKAEDDRDIIAIKRFLAQYDDLIPGISEPLFQYVLHGADESALNALKKYSHDKRHNFQAPPLASLEDFITNPITWRPHHT